MMKPLRIVSMTGMLLAASTLTHALEGMDDEQLSGETARDGVTMIIQLPDFDGAGPGTDIGFKANQVLFHDTNGFLATTDAGAIVHGTGVAGDRLEFTMAAGRLITATVDMVGDTDVLAGSQSMLNVSLDIPAFTFKTGKLYVARSNGVAAAVSSMTAAISDGMTFNVGALTANIQLGNETQGSMIRVFGTMTGGMTATNYAVNDLNSGGSFYINAMAFDNNGVSTDLDVDVGVDFDATGMIARVNQLGTVSGGMDLTLSGVKVGTAASAAIGNVNVVGLNLATTQLRISGHL